MNGTAFPQVVPAQAAAQVARANRTRVLFVIPGYPESARQPASACHQGSPAASSMIFARRQADELRRQGMQVSVFYLTSRTSPGKLLQEYLRFRLHMRRWRPQVVHAHFGTVTALFTVLACRILTWRRVPVVITYRGSDLNIVPTARGLRASTGRLFSQIAALGASRIVCVSHSLRRKLWWRRAAATVLPSGVDLSRFQPEPQTAVRARLGWPPHCRVILFNAGHDPRNKRLDLAEASVAILRQQLPDVRFEVMRGDVTPARVPDLMNASDCLLLTSDAEGSPTVVQEALACGLPIVSVDVGDVVERLSGVEGTRTSARTPRALADALAGLLQPPRRSAGPQRAVELSSTRIAQTLTELYSACAEARR